MNTKDDTLLPLQAIVIKGVKRFRSVRIVDQAGVEIDHVETCESAKFAAEIARKINESGRWTTGISGNRYERLLSTGERA